MKKVVDKRKNLWYPIRVADEDNEQERKRLSDSEPWQMNSNATLKIPDQESGSADLKEFQRTKPKDSKPENKTGKPDIWQEDFLTWEFDPGSGWTLAACLTHASRTGSDWNLVISELVADGWVTRG